VRKVSSVAVVGLGSLGSFLCDSLSKVETIEKLVLIDYDTVQEKNLINSVYRESDIGEFKVNAMRSIVTGNNPSLVVHSICAKYTTELVSIYFRPDVDLVTDCRDFTYDRTDEIDVRMYITSRYLVLDCRKDVSYSKHYEGMYISQLTKTDLRNAALTVSLLIQNGLIFDLIEKQLVHKIELDYICRKTSEIIQSKGDMILDLKEDTSSFLNLPECLDRILDENKKHNLTMYFGDKENSLIWKEAPRNSLLNIGDVISCLQSIIKLPFAFNYYIILLKSNSDGFYIELIPETGAA
jgi:hypothetical protein